LKLVFNNSESISKEDTFFERIEKAIGRLVIVWDIEIDYEVEGSLC